jgi:aminopeptidase N
VAAHAREWHSVVAAQRADLVIADPGVSHLFDQRVYKRGGLALHALRVQIGDERFFRLLREWADGNQHGSVATEQFMALAGADVAELLQAWLYAKPLPRLG